MTPRRAIVPMEATPEMTNAAIEGRWPLGMRGSIAAAIAAASPNAGRISAADLERAAEAAHALQIVGAKRNLVDELPGIQTACRDIARAVFRSAGLAIEGDAP